VHDEDCIHEHTPREAAQYHLNARIPLMKVQNFCLADAVVPISEVVGMIANAPVHNVMNENDAGCSTESAKKI
jgi:hypothetical protein